MSYRPRRSMLYMPGANARALDKARSLPADALILDLEDAVAPDAKAEARNLVVEAVQTGGYAPREVIVRINALDTLWGRDDLLALGHVDGIDGLLLPKVSAPVDVHQALDAMDQSGVRSDMPLWIMAETAQCLLSIDAIAASSARLVGIVLGTSDLARELRIPHTPSRIGFLTGLSLCVYAARAHGLDVIDGVYLDLNDEDGFAASCTQGRELGFDGKSLIHPKQIAAANAAFSPPAHAAESAQRIIDAWQTASAAGQGVVVVDGRLVENLHVDEARRTLDMLAAIAQREAAH